MNRNSTSQDDFPPLRDVHGWADYPPDEDTFTISNGRDVQAPDSHDSVKAYYLEQGYVVLRGLIPDAVCREARKAFELEIKPFQGHLYRQASANPERHVFTPHGFMLNSLLNIQDVGSRRFPRFWRAGMNIVTAMPLQKIVSLLLGQPGKVVQSMYFEGNPTTWAHQDTYYLDAKPYGSMTAAWIALEDIHSDAGRFFIYPGSHRIDMANNGGDFDIAFNHDRYKKLVLDVIARYGLERRAPTLQTGDVLFWSSKTIHGSLETDDPPHSRSSITVHFIPRSAPFIQYQARERGLKTVAINGMEVHCPKDQNRTLNRLIMSMQAAFPTPYKVLKKSAVKLLTR